METQSTIEVHEQSTMKTKIQEVTLGSRPRSTLFKLIISALKRVGRRLHKWIRTDGFGREEWERIEYRNEFRARKANRAFDENWYHLRR